MNSQFEKTTDPPIFGSHGEFVYPICWVSFVEMATAISRIYVSDGFTVAADGRERCVETGHISSDSEQKIFGLHHCCGELACAVTGAGRIGERYRLSEEIPAIALALAESEARNVGEYAELLGNELKRSIDGRFKPNKKSLRLICYLMGISGIAPIHTSLFAPVSPYEQLRPLLEYLPARITHRRTICRRCAQ
jgi:hypothetical protein